MPCPYRVLPHREVAPCARREDSPARGLVVRVQVPAEGRHAEIAVQQQVGHLAGQLPLVPGHPAVGDAQENALHIGAEAAQCLVQFPGTDGRQIAGSRGTAVRVGGLTGADGDQAQPDAGRREDGDGAAEAEDLVVGMGGDHHHAGPAARGGRQVGERVDGGQGAKPLPGPPVGFRGAGFLDRVRRRRLRVGGGQGRGRPDRHTSSQSRRAAEAALPRSARSRSA